MKRLMLNSLVNLGGRGVSFIAAIFFVPAYLHYLSIEAFAFVGFYLALQGLAPILDVGLGAASAREVARHHHDTAAQAQAVRSAGLPVAGLIALLAILWIPFSESFGRIWFGSAAAGPAVLVPLGLAVIAQLGFFFYLNILIALQRHRSANLLLGTTSVARGLVSVVALHLFGPSLTHFFVAQLLVSLTQWLLSGFLVWEALHGGFHRTQMNKTFLRSMATFGAGSAVAAASAAILVQADRLLLSKILPLSEFGTYAAVATLASGIVFLGIPVFVTMYPPLCALIKSRDKRQLEEQYFTASRLAMAMVAPVVAVLIFAPDQVLFLWTGDEAIVSAGASVLQILSVGFFLAVISGLSRQLQYAAGRTLPTTVQHVVGTLFFLALVMFLLPGQVDMHMAATAYAAALGLMTVIGIAYTHVRILPRRFLSWSVAALSPPTLAAFGVGWVVAGVLYEPTSRWGTLPGLALLGTTTLAAAAAATFASHRWSQKWPAGRRPTERVDA